MSNTLEMLEKNVVANLNHVEGLENTTMKIVENIVALIREATPAQFEAGMLLIYKAACDTKRGKRLNWKELDAKKYMRQFLYEANQAINHKLVQRDGTIATESGGKVEPIKTLRELRKVNEAKRNAAKAPTSAGKATGGQAKDLGDAAFERFCKAVGPFLPQLVEHGKLLNVAEYLSQQTGWEWSVYKK